MAFCYTCKFEVSEISGMGSEKPNDAAVNQADKDRFLTLWSRNVTAGAPDIAASVCASLAASYAEPHRRYHTIQHIRHALEQFDAAASLAHEPDAIELALWFHDAVYDPRANDNEARSAALFMATSRGQLPDALRCAVYDLIMITRHTDLPTSRDEELIVDIDLSSFGLPWEDYKRDGEAVREEYAHVADNRFHAGRSKFLRQLLKRPHFCFTEFFRARHEDIARRNIERSLRELA
ncbi:MAG: HD domain-containing protein [Gammaproteobacteria bacterium]